LVESIITRAWRVRYPGSADSKPKDGYEKNMPKTTRWSQHVTETSDALDIEQGTFSQDDPKAIADALMGDARRSHRRKSSPYRSAMSMLTFYINRAGRNLPAKRKKTLEQAKAELRESYGERTTRKRAR
jgi:hypothetical protein